MAEASDGGTAANTVRVWTFEVRGGESLELGFTKESGVLSPPLDHLGDHTVWKMVGTKAMAVEVEEEIQRRGCRVKRYTEEQNPEQEALRLLRLGRGG